MTSRLVVASAILLVVASTICGEPIYYAVSEEANYDRRSWHVGDLKQFQAKRPENVFDLYTFHRLSDGGARVRRELSSPFDDWLLILTYHYGSNGRLTKIDYDFRTSNGICDCGESGPVRCERSYLVDFSGKLRKTSEQIIKLETGQLVDWKFHEPQVRHWASLRELPIGPR